MSESPPDHYGKEKENIAANKVVGSGGNAKKRKAKVKSAKPNGKRPKVIEDNSVVDTHTAQEKDAAEAGATRSGRTPNLPSRFKDAGYAPPKRNVGKKRA